MREGTVNNVWECDLETKSEGLPDCHKQCNNPILSRYISFIAKLPNTAFWRVLFLGMIVTNLACFRTPNTHSWPRPQLSRGHDSWWWQPSLPASPLCIGKYLWILGVVHCEARYHLAMAKEETLCMVSLDQCKRHRGDVWIVQGFHGLDMKH